MSEEKILIEFTALELESIASLTCIDGNFDRAQAILNRIRLALDGREAIRQAIAARWARCLCVRAIMEAQSIETVTGADLDKYAARWMDNGGGDDDKEGKMSNPRAPREGDTFVDGAYAKRRVEKLEDIISGREREGEMKYDEARELLAEVETLPWAAKKAQWPEGSNEWGVLGWNGGRANGIEAIIVDHLTEPMAKLIAMIPGLIAENEELKAKNEELIKENEGLGRTLAARLTAENKRLATPTTMRIGTQYDHNYCPHCGLLGGYSTTCRSCFKKRAGPEVWPNGHQRIVKVEVESADPDS